MRFTHHLDDALKRGSSYFPALHLLAHKVFLRLSGAQATLGFPQVRFRLPLEPDPGPGAWCLKSS